MPIHGNANSSIKVDSTSCSPSNPSNVTGGFHTVSGMNFASQQSILVAASSTANPSDRATVRCNESKPLLTSNFTLTCSPSSTSPSASSPPLVRGKPQSAHLANSAISTIIIAPNLRTSQDLPLNSCHSESCFNPNHTHLQVFRSSSSSTSQYPNCLQDIGPSFLNVTKNYSSDSNHWQSSHHNSSFVFSPSSLPVSCSLRNSEFHPNLSMPVATLPKIDYHSNHRSSSRNLATLGSPNAVNTISGSSNGTSDGQNEASDGSLVNGCQSNKQSKPRRRVATIAQRRAANIRERRRMFHLNTAFDKLRKKVPTFAYEKRLSRIETLKLAVMYISFMTDVLRNRTVL